MTKHECIRVNASKVAAGYIDELKAILGLFDGEFRPRLVGYLANSDPSALTYAQWTARACQAIGIQFDLVRVQREQLEDTLLKANEDDTINGIMVYYPVFGGGHDQYIQSCLSAYKDVEGLCHLYRFNMYHNIRYLDEQRSLKCIIPCTPLAIIKILEHIDVYDNALEIGDQLQGKTITIVNRSEVVGRPLAALLANDGAKVYSVDVHDVLEFHRGQKQMKHYVTDTDLKLEQVLPQSDVVISGVPGAAFQLDTALLKPGVIAINFSTQNNFRPDVEQKAAMYVPSIGKVTIAMLQRNLLRLYNYQLQHRTCTDKLIAESC